MEAARADSDSARRAAKGLFKDPQRFCRLTAGSAVKRYLCHTITHRACLISSHRGPSFIAALYGVLSFDYNNPSQTSVNDVAFATGNGVYVSAILNIIGVYS